MHKEIQQASPWIIAVEGVSVRAFHGIYPEEQKTGSLFSVDARVEVAPHIVRDDTLPETVDYGVVYRIIVEVMREPVHLLETLLQRIASQVFEIDERIQQIELKISKLTPHLMPECERASVCVTYSR